LISLSDLSSAHIEKIAEESKKNLAIANNNIKNVIERLIEEDTKVIAGINVEIFAIQDTATFKNGKVVFDENKQLTEIIRQLEELNKKLIVFQQENESLKKIYDEYKKIGQTLVEKHKEYLDDMNDIAYKMRMQYEDVSLNSSIVLKQSFVAFLNECISLRSGAMNELVEKTVAGFKKQTKADIEDNIKNIVNEALHGNVTFKGGYDVQAFMSKLFAECWYELTLNVEYDGDNLKDMSPGKRSFVILKLLLDFSEKKCPILIDQPEDNLDNRAIYGELVKYIRRKKKERQIILVTHNPNIVVGADSEEVIIANQNGKNSPNTDKIKFQYKIGGLEYSSKRKNDESIPILDRCGIREHVCDILEGGEKAFRDRENKYGFFKI
jgi:ABC-type lipoprotein export system ATPase subunit